MTEIYSNAQVISGVPWPAVPVKSRLLRNRTLSRTPSWVTLVHPWGSQVLGPTGLWNAHYFFPRVVWSHIHSIGQHFLGSTGDDAGWGRCQERAAQSSPSTASNNAAAALLLAEQTQQVLELRGGAWKKAVPDIMCNWLHAPLFLYLMLFTKDLSL